MPGPFLHSGLLAACPHFGQLSVQPLVPRVKVSGMPVATAADLFKIAGCINNVSGAPQPCVTVRWLAVSARVKVNGSPVVLSPGPGLCQSAQQIPQGLPVFLFVQPRVKGS